MHLLIPHASSLSEACTQTLKDLQLPHLTQLLRRLSPTERNESDEYSLSPPHERALAQALGFAGPDGGLPWAAYLAARDGVETQDLCWGLLTPMHWHVGADHVTMVDPQALQLDEAESRELLEAVRPLFESEGWLLIYGAPTRWYGAHESLADLPTASPDRVIGRNVDLWMPDHPQARLVRRLQNEVQMLLYTHPCTDRRVEQGRERGSQPLHEVAGQRGEGGIARVQGRREPALGPEQLDVAIDPERERLGRWVGGGQLRPGLGEVVDPRLHDGLDQVRALREVPVQRADAHPGEIGDLLRRGVHA